MHKQKGLSLSALLGWSVFLILIAIFSMKLAPVYIEYFSIKKNLTTIVKETNLQETDHLYIKQAFSKRAQIDGIKSITAQDIKISRENGRPVLIAKYTVKIPIISNISLNIDFEAVSN
jgi:hypothetical protein